MRARWIVAIVVFVGAFVLLTGVLVLALAARQATITVPQVSFETPSLGEAVHLGATTLVRAVARDPDGVARAELWIDGSLVEVKTSGLSGGSTPLPLLADWTPGSLGAHTLIVRAFDTQGVEGQAAVIVEVAETSTGSVYVVGEPGEPLSPEAIAGLAEEHPELAEAVQAGEIGLEAAPEGEEGVDAPPEASPVPEEEPPEIAPSIGNWVASLSGWTTGTFALPSEWLEIEALSLEVDKDYDGVNCYFLIGGTMTVERVPAEGSLPTPGGRLWDVAAALGGDNKRLVPIPADRGPLEIYLSCLGVNETSGGGEVIELGTLRTQHLPGDWDGRRLEHWVMGDGGWFRVAYQIVEAGGGGGDGEGLAGPSGLSRRCFENPFLNIITCVLSWYYPEDRLGEINGYLLIRDGGLFANLPLGLPAADDRQVPLLEGDGVPTCGERFEYWLVAYQGDLIAGNRSAESNHVVLEAEACDTRTVRVTFETLNTVCLTGDCVDNPFELDTEGRYMAPEGPLDAEGCNRGQGCEGGENYARMWANEHMIYLGGMNDFGIVFAWVCGGIYPVAGAINPGQEHPLEFMLTPFESLEIGMRVYDFDAHSGDDLQCSGGYLFTPDDLRAISHQPEHRQTFTRVFNQEGGGGCYLVFTIEASPRISLPEYEPPEPIGP
jgi:hypothetical protein